MQTGSPSVLQIFNEYLQKGGEETSVDRVFHTLEANRQPVVQCRFASSEWVGAGRGLRLYEQGTRMVYNPAAVKKLLEIHAKSRPNLWLLHNVFPVGSAGIYREIKRLGVPAITYIHNFRPFSVNGYLWANDRVETAGLRKNFWPEIRAGAWQDSRLKTLWYAMILKGLHAYGAYTRMDAWIAISDFMREVFIDAGIESAKIHTIRHSWDPMASPPPQRDDGYYLFLGRLAPMKGVGELLDTWQLLEKEMGASCPRLVIAGEGPLREEVERRAAGSRQVQYAGQVSGDVKSGLISGCRAMIAPSVWWEPLGLVTYEAYDYNKPMLAARSGGLTETVVDGETGFLHEPGNTRQLAGQIVELENHPRKRQDFGREGRAWLLAHTRKSDWTEKFLSLVRRVTGS